MIVVQGVSKAFGRTSILKQFSMSIPPAGRQAVLGPSGCGKTTLLRLIAGLELPDEGEIWLDGRQASRPGWGQVPHLRGTGMVFQASTLFPHMTVVQNIRYGCDGLAGVELNSRLNDLMERLELSGLAKHYPHQLSGGEARRVALARALAPRPRVLLLDEALTNLNPTLKQRVLSLLRQYLDEHRPALVYVTHDAEEASLLGAKPLTLSRSLDE